MPQPRIYFAGSIRGGREDAQLYAHLIADLSTLGVVLTEHVGTVPDGGERGLTDQEIHDRDLRWLEEADLVVAEVSVPSLGVGYELARAEQMGKPVLCLFRKSAGRRLSAMIRGCPAFTVVDYTEPAEVMEPARRALRALAPADGRCRQ